MAFKNDRLKIQFISAAVVIFGMFTSGPVGSLIVQIISPQPGWKDPATYIQNYSTFQSFPFYFGFVLMLGFILFFSSTPEPETDLQKIYGRLVIYFSGGYISLITLNYLIQIALIPYALDNPRLIELFSVLNPKSLFWFLEMIGYGFLGLATWSAGMLYGNDRNGRIIKNFCIANGIISVLGSAFTFIFIGWTQTIPGLICYLAWNILILVLMIFVMKENKKEK